MQKYTFKIHWAFILLCLIVTSCTDGELTTNASGTARPNLALNFNGASDGVSLTHGSTSVGSVFTEEAYILLNSSPASNGMIYMRRNAGTVVWGFLINNSRRIEIWYYNGSCSGNATVTGTTILTVGQKYHVAVDSDGTNMRTYINGVLDSTTGAAPDACALTNSSIGYDFQTGLNYFPGKIDNLRISTYARYAGSNFTPPTAPYSYAGEYLLYTFDYGTNSGNISTSSTGFMSFSFVGSPTYMTSPFF